MAAAPHQLPDVIGHRGAAAAAPENTLASFAEARRQGATWVETDVVLAGDSVPVLMHDPTLDRTTDRSGPVDALSAGDLARCDAGSWFDPRFADERVPALEDALSQLRRLGLGLDLEIKPLPGMARETARVALAALCVWDGPLVVSSFSEEALGTALEVRPDIPRVFLMHRWRDDWSTVADRLGCLGLGFNHALLSPARVAEVRAGGLLCAAYTVNDPEEGLALWDMGVTSVISDTPGRLLEAREVSVGKEKN